MRYKRYPEYLEAFKESKKNHSNYDEKNILIIRNFTLEMVFEPYMNYFLHFMYMHANIDYVNFDEIANDFDFNKYDYVIFWIRIENIINNLKKSEKEKIENIGSIVARINGIISKCRKEIIFVEFDPIYYSSTSNMDVLLPDSLPNIFEESYEILNSSNVYYLKTKLIYIRHGAEKILNSNYSENWDMPYSKFAFCEYANLIVSFIVGQQNKQKNV